jgi:soluble cytochrome b562
LALGERTTRQQKLLLERSLSDELQRRSRRACLLPPEPMTTAFMNTRFRSFGIVCALSLSLAQVAFGQAQEEKTPLGKKMTAINAAFKVIGRQVDDPAKNADTMEQLTIIETNVKAGMTLEPAKKEKVPAGDQAKFVADYQAGMKHFLALIGKTKAALKAGKNPEAAALVDSLKSLQRDSHKEFRIRKEGQPPA